VTAWGALRARLPDLAAKMRDLRPPKLRVVVDGQVVYGALVVPEEGDLEAHFARFGGPSRLEGWLLERLALLEERFPGAREVELLRVWAGNPPRLEVIARVRPRSPSP
jgi:hypothetical protein